MKKALAHIKHWALGLARSFAGEFKHAFSDTGVIVFFVVLCLTYPILYALIYNTEVAHDEPIVVVDHCRTQLSRELVRRCDATQQARVAGYAASMQEARDMLASKRCFAILLIPQDFSSKIGRGEQGHVMLYCEMSLLMRYKAFLTALTAASSSIGTDMQVAAVSPYLYQGGSIIESKQVALGNTSTGIASALLPWIFIYVLQQSLILGTTMIYAAGLERRRKHGGRDPLAAKASPLASILGRSLAHLAIYVLPCIYILYYCLRAFSFPMNGNIADVLALLLPFLLATSLLAQTLQVLITDRENVFVTFVFTSLIFVFLAGISWPRYAMSPLFQALGNMVPGTWMSQGYTLITSVGSKASQLSLNHHMLWTLCGVFLVLSWLVERFISRPRYKAMRQASKADKNALFKREMEKYGINVEYDPKASNYRDGSITTWDL